MHKTSSMGNQYDIGNVRLDDKMKIFVSCLFASSVKKWKYLEGTKKNLCGKLNANFQMIKIGQQFRMERKTAGKRGQLQ